MKFFFLFISIISVIVSCSEVKYNNIETIFNTEKNLNVVKLNHHADDIIYPIMSFLALNNQIITTGLYSDYVFNIYSTTSPYQWRGVIVRGRGTNELVQTSSVSIHNDTLYFFTPGNVFKKIGNIIGENPLIESIGTVKGTNDFFNLFKTNDGYIANGIIMESDSQFAYLNNDFSVRQYFDSYPVKSEYNHSKADLAMGLQGSIEFLTDKNNFIYTSNVGCILKFFSLNNGVAEKTKEYIYHYPIFENADFGNAKCVAHSKENTKGVLSSTIDDKYYYLLYDGRIFSDGIRDSDLILVFDANGNPITKLKLNKRIEMIAFDQTSKRMFAQGQDDDIPYFYEILLNY